MLVLIQNIGAFALALLNKTNRKAPHDIKYVKKIEFKSVGCVYKFSL